MDQATFRGDPDLLGKTGLLLAEDEALKKYLQGLKVPDVRGGSPIDVGVWFRWPTSERQIEYPFITIDQISAELDNNLLHSDHVRPTYGSYRPSVSATLPEPPQGWAAQDYAIRNYWPFILSYQISVFARSNLHDRYLRSVFITDVLPPRPFWIGCDVDDTWRRTEMVSMSQRDRSETSESGTKRIFQKVYTISMMAEVPQDRLEDATFMRAFKLLVNVEDKDTNELLDSFSHQGVEALTPSP